MSNSYKDTMNLPETDFPMRGNLPAREPERLAQWQEMDIYRRVLEKNADGNAVINTLQQLAGAIGTSVVSTLVASAQAARPDDMARATMEGSRSAFYLLTVLAVAVILCSCGVFFAGRKKAGSADRG